MRTLVIADHPVIFSTLHHLIDSVGAFASVVAASSAADVRLALADESQFDLVLLDLQMNGAQGLGLLMEIRIDHPALPVVAISAPHGEEARQVRPSSNGLAPIDKGIKAVDPAQRTALAAETGLPRSSGCSFSGTVARQAGRCDASAAPQVGRAPVLTSHEARGRFGLTPRQTDVLELLMKGQPNKLIARELDLSVETVKDHVGAIFRALKVSSRTQAVVVASRKFGD